MDKFTLMLDHLKTMLDVHLFTLGSTAITLWTLLSLSILAIVLVYVSKLLKRWLVNGVLARRGMEVGVRQAIGTITHYVFVFIGFLVILSNAGIDLTALNVLAGAIGIGLGFGLQSSANNFISGLIILFERPLKVGDRIHVGGVEGDVVRIAARATTIRTNQNIEIIVPNAEFVSSQVINWSHSDRKVRFDIPVGVSYSSDPEVVRQALLEVAAEHRGVLASPSADVIFEEFGDSALQFVLRVWSTDYITIPKILRSDLNFAIQKKFREKNIQVPFPQRDVHIRSSVTGLENR